jgi:hypothetical protein
MTRAIKTFLLPLISFVVVGVLSVNYTAFLYLLIGFLLVLIIKSVTDNPKTAQKLVKIRREFRKIIFSRTTFAILILLLVPTRYYAVEYPSSYYAAEYPGRYLDWLRSQLYQLRMYLDTSAIQASINLLNSISQFFVSTLFFIFGFCLIGWSFKELFFISFSRRTKFGELIGSLIPILVGSSLLLATIAISERIQ